MFLLQVFVFALLAIASKDSKRSGRSQSKFDNQIKWAVPRQVYNTLSSSYNVAYIAIDKNLDDANEFVFYLERSFVRYHMRLYNIDEHPELWSKSTQIFGGELASLPKDGEGYIPNMFYRKREVVYDSGSTSRIPQYKLWSGSRILDEVVNQGAVDNLLNQCKSNRGEPNKLYNIYQIKFNMPPTFHRQVSLMIYKKRYFLFNQFLSKSLGMKVAPTSVLDKWDLCKVQAGHLVRTCQNWHHVLAKNGKYVSEKTNIDQQVNQVSEFRSPQETSEILRGENDAVKVSAEDTDQYRLSKLAAAEGTINPEDLISDSSDKFRGDPFATDEGNDEEPDLINLDSDSETEQVDPFAQSASLIRDRNSRSDDVDADLDYPPDAQGDENDDELQVNEKQPGWWKRPFGTRRRKSKVEPKTAVEQQPGWLKRKFGWQTRPKSE